MAPPIRVMPPEVMALDIETGLRDRCGGSEGALTAAAMRGGLSNLQSLIFIAAMVVAVDAVRSISIFPSGNASR